MIWYTYLADLNVIENQFVQLSSDGSKVELHSNGTPLGLCIRVDVMEDTQERVAQVYSAGGSGENAILGTNWNGSPSRFDVINSKVVPVSSNGIGWIIPDFPKASKVSGDAVRIALYD